MLAIELGQLLAAFGELLHHADRAVGARRLFELAARLGHALLPVRTGQQAEEALVHRQELLLVALGDAGLQVVVDGIELLALFLVDRQSQVHQTQGLHEVAGRFVRVLERDEGLAQSVVRSGRELWLRQRAGELLDRLLVVSLGQVQRAQTEVNRRVAEAGIEGGLIGHDPLFVGLLAVQLDGPDRVGAALVQRAAFEYRRRQLVERDFLGFAQGAARIGFTHLALGIFGGRDVEAILAARRSGVCLFGGCVDQRVRFQRLKGVEGLGIVRIETQRALHGLFRLVFVFDALEVEGQGQVFADGPLGFAGAFVGSGELGVDLDQAGGQVRGPFPVADGLIQVALADVDVSHLDVLLGGFAQAAHPLQDVGALLQRDRIVGRELVGARVNLEGFLQAARLEQRQTQTTMGIRVFRKLLDGAAIGGNGFVPLLIPGRAVPGVHCLVVDCPISGHTVLSSACRERSSSPT